VNSLLTCLATVLALVQTQARVVQTATPLDLEAQTVTPVSFDLEDITCHVRSQLTSEQPTTTEAETSTQTSAAW